MTRLYFRLFSRIIARNREVYVLKILALAIASATTVLITLFSIHEFGYDKFHHKPEAVFRIVQKNMDENYSGNRLSTNIPVPVVNRLKNSCRDTLVISRVKIMNDITVSAGPESFPHQKIHAADPAIGNIFSFETLDGDLADFPASNEITAIISARAAKKYTKSHQAAGKKLRLVTLGDTLDVKIAAVFEDFPDNSHEDFDVFISFDQDAIASLNFNPEETGIYGRSLYGQPHCEKQLAKSIEESPWIYSCQPLPAIYFGPRVLGEEARHGDSYSVIILISITGLILLLSLCSFVNLTTITLPYRAKELAVKKLAGTSQATLLLEFLRESATIVVISFGFGLVILVLTNRFTEPILGLRILPMIFDLDFKLILIVVILFIVFSISPVLMTRRFIRASPGRLLSTDIITFPRLKRLITIVQLGISIFLIMASVIIRRQIAYSTVKEPGQNHDQVVYLNCPSGITNEGILALRSGWRKHNPNILDVMAVSQLPDRISSKEVDSEFYFLKVDRGYREFFGLRMEEGYWFGPNSGDSAVVMNRMGKERLSEKGAQILGVVEDVNGLFNQPQKPVKMKLAGDYNYNWLCVRVLEVDIRRTVARLSDQFSAGAGTAHVNYLNKQFKLWLDYQDRLNTLSGILAIISGLLSCFAIYGLSISLVRDKIRQIAVHKLFGARTSHITYLLVREFANQLLIAIALFVPLTYIALNELLRSFVYATKFSWLDPFYPAAYCASVIIGICVFQANGLNRTDFAAALKS